MRRLTASFLLGAIALVGTVQAEVPAEQRLQIEDADALYEITVPLGRLILNIPRGDLHPRSNRQGGATESPRYFYLTDPTSQTVVSGWFEPASRQHPLQESWKKEMESLKAQGFGAPVDVSTDKVRGWDLIFYGLPMPEGSSSHVRASFIGAGTWIDMHVSVSSPSLPSSETREQAMALMESMTVREK